MTYADKRRQSIAECTNARCPERGEALRVFHGQLDWYCPFHADQIDKFQGRP